MSCNQYRAANLQLPAVENPVPVFNCLTLAKKGQRKIQDSVLCLLSG